MAISVYAEMAFLVWESVMSTIYDWSLNATNNANADDNINWAEGQLPSSVNNSARAMMQRIREFVTDLSGTASASGAANNITVMSASAVVAYNTGIVMRFRALERNTGAVTLRLNNLAAKPVFKTGYTGVVPLSGGEIQREGIYELIYNPLLNSGAGGWLLSAPTPPRAFPAGMIMPFAAVTPPPDWLVCNGMEISRTAYADLFAVIATLYGAGNGTTTFNLPDYRGMFLRGFDAGRGIDPGRVFGKRQENENRKHSHTTTSSGSIQTITHANSVGSRNNVPFNITIPQNGEWSDFIRTGRDVDGWDAALRFRTSSNDINATVTISDSGGAESRPVNMPVTYIIKT